MSAPAQRDVAHELVAHSPGATAEWHSLSDHLASTGKLCGQFSAPFESQLAGQLVGHVHDLGKADPAWQHYLRTVATGVSSPTVDHKTAGALLLSEWGVAVLAPLVLGHHGGLTNAVDARARLTSTPTDGQQAASARASDLGLSPPRGLAGVVPSWAMPVSGQDRAGLRRLEFWMRMVFSALIDADRLDTASFLDADRPTELGNSSIAANDSTFQTSRRAALGVRLADPIADAREVVFQEIVTHAPEPPGWFELTAPTGAGKTLGALGFALRHAAAHGLRRVVSAVPFISVTEQVADSYRSVLDSRGDGGVVLEHHSGVRTRNEGQVGAGLWGRLAVENWDATIVVTTTVRLLETMFENGTSDVRRLHRLARSVIVLDEVQSIPWRLIEPTLEVLRDLVRYYGCTVVLSTATQPPFELVGEHGGAAPRQLLDPAWFDVFRRARAVFEPTPLSWEEIGDRVHGEAERNGGQCLAVVNTIKDARALTRQLVGREGLFHLSTRLCQRHRRDVLRAVNHRLAAGHPCVLISTQIVEAGVDLDFPVAFRAVAPMTAIAQVAGRVNRHGFRPEGVLYVVDPADGGTPPDEYRIGCNVTRDLLRMGVDPLNANSMATYFERFLDATRSLLDKEHIQREREMHNFENVAERYRIIADDTTSVVVSYDGFDATKLKPPTAPKYRWMFNRRVQPYLVGLRRREFTTVQQAGLVEDLGGGLHAWHGDYDEMFGLVSTHSTEALIW